MILWLVLGAVFLIFWLSLELPSLRANLQSKKTFPVGEHIEGHLLCLLFAALAGGVYLLVVFLWSTDNGNAFTATRETSYSVQEDVRMVAENPKRSANMNVIWTDPRGIQHKEDSGYVVIVQVPDDEPTRYVKRTLLAYHPFLVPWQKTGPNEVIKVLYVHEGQVVAK